MPTLEELRRWARGEAVEGLPAVKPRKEVERPKVDASALRSTKYKLNPDATDALLQFGAFRGQTISSLVTSARGRKYINWILEQDFDDTLKSVCRYHLELMKRA